MTSKDHETPPAGEAPAGKAPKPSARRKDAGAAAEAQAEAHKERIAKAMARVGLCSRREAEEWIAAGRVAVNGTVLTSP
ncbi:hypothetical protein J8J40_26545, partial [Mycobacterium tuberculosis]|nr:hypothetical protein [Mycobacterium tuberculosis]MBP0650611.1 hypothetical protein [Mycobacterium tuberculosis]